MLGKKLLGIESILIFHYQTVGSVGVAYFHRFTQLAGCNFTNNYNQVLVQTTANFLVYKNVLKRKTLVTLTDTMIALEGGVAVGLTGRLEGLALEK